MRPLHIFLPLVFSLAATAAVAQTPSGTVTGTVRGSDGLPVPFVNVGVVGTALGAASDARGVYTILNVPAGEQAVAASAVGFEPVTQQVAVEAGGTARLDFALAQTVGELGEVTVTGQQRRTSAVTKTMTPLEDLPISVQIVGEELMRQQQAVDLRDVVRNVSGVTATGTYNGGYVYYNGRGFWMNNWSNFRRNGMMVWNMGHHYADHVEQVEVLKGPASIQYGDVAPGGIMNFVTKKPLPYSYGRAELKLGQYGLLRPTLDVSGPLTAGGGLLYRLNATYERSGSFRDEVESEAVMLAPALTWKPLSRLHWTVEGTYKRDDRVGDPGLISPDGTFEGLEAVPVSTFLGEPGARYAFEDKGLFSTADYYVSDRLRVRNVTYYSDTYRAPNNIYLDATAADPEGRVRRSQYNYRQWFRGWGTDLHLGGAFATGPLTHEAVAGADYMFNHSRFTNGIDAALANDISLEDPAYGVSPLAPDTTAWATSRFFYERLGLYVQDQVSALGGRVQALLGLRYNVTTSGDRYDDPAAAPEGYRPNTDRPVSPRLGLLVKPAGWASLYASYAESYEMNGPDWIDPSILVGPTTASQVEVGAKASLLEDRLGVTLSVFRLSKEDIYNWVDAVEEPGFDYVAWDSAGAWATYQGGLHRSRGVELDVNGRIGEALTLNAAAAYVDAFVVEDPAYAAGNQLEGNARVTGSLWANYAVPAGHLKGLELGYGVFYRGPFYQSTANDPDGRVDAFYSMDASVAYTFRRLTGRLTVTNLTDEVGYLSSFGVYEPLWVRRALLSLAARF